MKRLTLEKSYFWIYLNTSYFHVPKVELNRNTISIFYQISSSSYTFTGFNLIQISYIFKYFLKGRCVFFIKTLYFFLNLFMVQLLCAKLFKRYFFLTFFTYQFIYCVHNYMYVDKISAFVRTSSTLFWEIHHLADLMSFLNILLFF